MTSLEERYHRNILAPWTAQKNASHFEVREASGSQFTTADGRRVLDFSSQVFNGNLGHAHPVMRKAMVEAAQKADVWHPASLHEDTIQLGENLARISPSGLTKSFFCLGGAEATENAVKIARLVTKRYKVITRYRSYHGATLTALALSGDYRRIPFEPMLPGVIRIPDPYPRGSGQQIDTVRLLEEIIEVEGPETIACMLLEGVTGANGVFVPDSDYWPRIRKICDQHGILLVADEVLSGFGRTGKWFAVDHMGVCPDMMTTAKGLTGGYAPLGAVMVNEKIAQHFEDATLWCGLTSYGNPFSCAVANAAIGIYENEHLIENAAQRGLELKQHLKELETSHDRVAETRSIGLLAAIDLRKSKEDDAPYVAYRARGEELKKAKHLQQNLFEAGVFCVVRFGTVLLAPPLCITSDELAKGMRIIQQLLP